MADTVRAVIGQYWVREGIISILSRYRGMRRDIVVDFEYCYVVIWLKCCLLLVVMTALL